MKIANDTMLKIQAQDGEIEVSQKLMNKSILVKSIIDDSSPDDEIPLPEVTIATILKCLELSEILTKQEWVEIETPIITNQLKGIIPSVFVNYIDLDNDILFDLILAANYLDFKELMLLSSAKIASLMKNKDINEIRNMFGIENDFTPEEEAKMDKENKWIEDAY